MNNEDKNKFPKSQSGLQCLSPCYPADLPTLHPITLRYHTSDLPYCHVTNKVNEDGTDNIHNGINEIDTCFNPISINEYKKLNVDILIPILNFNCKYFLVVFYNIKNLEEGLNYIDKKKYTSILTRARIIDCILKVYGENIEIIDQRFIDFFIELAKKKWIVNIYNSIYTYIYADENIVKFINPKNNYLNYNDYKVERINFIIVKFINYDEMYKFINKYISYKKDKWNDIENFINNIEYEFIIYIETKINITLN